MKIVFFSVKDDLSERVIRELKNMGIRGIYNQYL